MMGYCCHCQARGCSWMSIATLPGHVTAMAANFAYALPSVKVSVTPYMPVTVNYWDWDLADVIEPVFLTGLAERAKLSAIVLGDLFGLPSTAGGYSSTEVNWYYANGVYLPAASSAEETAVLEYLDDGGELILVLPIVDRSVSSPDYAQIITKVNAFLSTIGVNSRVLDPDNAAYNPYLPIEAQGIVTNRFELRSGAHSTPFQPSAYSVDQYDFLQAVYRSHGTYSVPFEAAQYNAALGDTWATDEVRSFPFLTTPHDLVISRDLNPSPLLLDNPDPKTHLAYRLMSPRGFESGSEPWPSSPAPDVSGYLSLVKYNHDFGEIGYNDGPLTIGVDAIRERRSDGGYITIVTRPALSSGKYESSQFTLTDWRYSKMGATCRRMRLCQSEANVWNSSGGHVDTAGTISSSVQAVRSLGVLPPRTADSNFAAGIPMHSDPRFPYTYPRRFEDLAEGAYSGLIVRKTESAASDPATIGDWWLFDDLSGAGFTSSRHRIETPTEPSEAPANHPGLRFTISASSKVIDPRGSGSRTPNLWVAKDGSDRAVLQDKANNPHAAIWDSARDSSGEFMASTAFANLWADIEFAKDYLFDDSDIADIEAWIAAGPVEDPDNAAISGKILNAHLSAATELVGDDGFDPDAYDYEYIILEALETGVARLENTSGVWQQILEPTLVCLRDGEDPVRLPVYKRTQIRRDIRFDQINQTFVGYEFRLKDLPDFHIGTDAKPCLFQVEFETGPLNWDAEYQLRFYAPYMDISRKRPRLEFEAKYTPFGAVSTDVPEEEEETP